MPGLTHPVRTAPTSGPLAVNGTPGAGLAATGHADRHGRVAHLDGLRGLAVAAVVASHWLGFRVHVGGVALFVGGYVGVDVFFVLSGLVITTLLVRRPTSYRDFVTRRFRRLYPPLIAVVAVGVVACVIVPNSPASLWTATSNAGVVLGQLGWWWRSAGIGVLDPFGHTWSLSVEWAFYLVFPAVVTLLRRRGLTGVPAAAGCLTVATGAYLLATRVQDAPAFYFSPLSHTAGLLAGAAGAYLLAWRPQLPARTPGWPAAVVGAGLTAVVLWAVFGDNHDQPAYRHFVLPAATLVTLGVVLAGAWWPGATVTRALRWAPLTALGRVSYSLYLWHYPAVVLLTTERTGWSVPEVAASVVATTVIGTTASYLVLERVRPARREPPVAAGPTAPLPFAAPAGRRT